MSTDQEYWDACLIRTWRNFGSMGQAYAMFHSITNEWPEKVQPRLLRIPKEFLPNKVGVRFFCASYLPKINDFLCDKPKEKDVELLRALKNSNMDTLDKRLKSNSDKELDNLRAKISYSRTKMAGNTISYSIRNHDTDWNVTKGGKRGRA